MINGPGNKVVGVMQLAILDIERVAAVGAAVPLGAEQGFASLVDLRTGDIVWFNVVGAGSGEMRDEEGAVAAVNTLFRDIPTNNPPVEE